MPVQRISFQSIPVADQDRAISFYQDILGFELQVDAPFEDDWRWIFLSIPGSDSRITFSRPDEIVVKDKPVLALVSDDVDADCVRWREAGVKITNDPQDAPWAPGVRWATIRDSEDNILFVESAASGGQDG